MVRITFGQDEVHVVIDLYMHPEDLLLWNFSLRQVLIQAQVVSAQRLPEIIIAHVCEVRYLPNWRRPPLVHNGSVDRRRSIEDLLGSSADFRPSSAAKVLQIIVERLVEAACHLDFDVLHADYSRIIGTTPTFLSSVLAEERHMQIWLVETATQAVISTKPQPGLGKLWSHQQ